MRVVSAFLVFFSILVCALLMLSRGPAFAQEGPAAGQAEKKPQAKKKAEGDKKAYVLRHKLKAGARYVGSNTVAFKLKTEVRRGKVTQESSESVERTERFRDHVTRASESGPVEIERVYQKRFTKVRSSENERPDVDQSPLQGRTVTIIEKRRSRRIKGDGSMTIPAIVRKSVGLEMDWRDILPRDPVHVGDTWEADAEVLARRMAVYLESGSRSRMIVTFEGIDRSGGRERAKFYVDWQIDGMRDRQLFTKIRMAGDVYFDLEMQRFTYIDLAGQFGVGGAIVAPRKAPEIIKAEGTVSYKSSLREVAVAAAAGK
ncbi:MAG: hypothetical protein ACYTHK_07685 [Planctomycetota bacterium]|jgi:hypothetical protein